MMMVQIRMGVESWIGNSRILDGVVINCNGKIWGRVGLGVKIRSQDLIILSVRDLLYI